MRGQEGLGSELEEPVSVASDRADDLFLVPSAMHDRGPHRLVLVTLEGTEEARVEEAKAALKAALKDLTDTLSDVHWPAHNDQSGEDYSMTNEEWTEVLQKAEDGKKLATEKVSAAWKASRALKDVQQASIDGLRRQIAGLDRSIARNT